MRTQSQIDVDAAISDLISVAAELVRMDGIPDPELSEFKPIGRRTVREIQRANCVRGVRIKTAVDVLRKAMED